MTNKLKLTVILTLAFLSFGVIAGVVTTDSTIINYAVAGGTGN